MIFNVANIAGASMERPLGDNSEDTGNEATQEEQEKMREFLCADSVSSVRISANYLLGAVPNEKECILRKQVYKADHNCQWSRRVIYLTSSSLLFSFEDEDCIRDRILLHEVRCPFRSLHHSLPLLLLKLTNAGERNRSSRSCAWHVGETPS